MRKCDVCDSAFEVTKFHPHQKRCSKKCRRFVIARRRRGLGVKEGTLTCAVCEKIFTPTRLSNTTYCSRGCKGLGSARKSQGLPVKGPKRHIHGSGYITTHGYKILSRKHPNASKKGQILEHVLIMSEHLGRALHRHETVHHRNGVRADNRIENLELWSHSHPFGQRVEDKLKWCKEFIAMYEGQNG